MSFIENSLGELGSPMDMLFRRPGSDKRTMPKQLVLSSSIEFVFIEPIIGSSGIVAGSELLLFQADSITKTKRFTEKKNFKPFGYSSNIVLTKDEGWDIRISGKKTDAILNSLIYWQEKFLNGDSNVYVAGVSNIKPQFNIRERITYLPNSRGEPSAIEEYIYRDVSIIGYEESVEDNATPATFSLACFSSYRDCTETISEISPMVSSVANIIDDLLSRNKQ